MFVVVLAAVLLRLGWVDPGQLTAAALFEALRAVVADVRSPRTTPARPAVPDPPADGEGG